MQRLTARGFAATTIALALQALRDHRYIDDAELARRRAEELLLRRLCGRVRVVDELTRRGLADSVIESAIASVMEECTDAELIRRALRRKYRASASAPAERSRAFRFLVTRGHPAEIVSEVLEDEGAAAYDEDEGQTISKGT